LKKKTRSVGLGLVLCAVAAVGALAAEPSPFAGTWTLVAADVIRPTARARPTTARARRAC
jgi:hypothetical protein